MGTSEEMALAFCLISVAAISRCYRGIRTSAMAPWGGVARCNIGVGSNLIWQVHADMIASYMKSLYNEVPACVIKLFTIKRKASCHLICSHISVFRMCPSHASSRTAGYISYIKYDVPFSEDVLPSSESITVAAATRSCI